MSDDKDKDWEPDTIPMPSVVANVNNLFLVVEEGGGEVHQCPIYDSVIVDGEKYSNYLEWREDFDNDVLELSDKETERTLRVE